MVQGICRSIDRDLKYMLGRYRSQKLRDCEDLFMEISNLLFSSVVNYLKTDSQLSCESDGDEYSSTDIGDQARDDELASVTLDSLHDKDVTDRTFTLADGDLYIQGHKCTEVDSPPRSSPILSSPRVSIIYLTLSESAPKMKTLSLRRAKTSHTTRLWIQSRKLLRAQPQTSLSCSLLSRST